MSHSKNDDFFSCFGLLHKRSRHHASRRLTLDKLEKRELLAADIELLGGVLTIDGTDQADYVEVAGGTEVGPALRWWRDYAWRQRLPAHYLSRHGAAAWVSPTNVR